MTTRPHEDGVQTWYDDDEMTASYDTGVEHGRQAMSDDLDRLVREIEGASSSGVIKVRLLDGGVVVSTRRGSGVYEGLGPTLLDAIRDLHGKVVGNGWRRKTVR